MRRLLVGLTVVIVSIAGVLPFPTAPFPGPAGAGTVYVDTVYEPDGPTGTVYRLYRAYFLREPDVDGYEYWLGQYRSGYPLTAISDDFARSAEFQSSYGNVDDSRFLELVYANVLEREPDRSGKEYWLGHLSAGMPRGTVMIHFSDSAEFRAETDGDMPTGYRRPVTDLAGTGPTRIEISIGAPVLVRATHDGDGTFAINALDDQDGYAGFAANEVGAYAGEQVLDLYRRVRFLEVEADGAWTIRIAPLSSAPSMDLGNGRGEGKHVRAVSVPTARHIRFTHDGDSQFAVWAYDADATYRRLLVSDVGTYDGTVFVPAGIRYLEITADGHWTSQAP